MFSWRVLFTQMPKVCKFTQRSAEFGLNVSSSMIFLTFARAIACY